SATPRADVRRRRVEVIRLAAGDRDIASVRGERQRDATTDPGAAAGDERHTAVQEIGAGHADMLPGPSRESAAPRATAPGQFARTGRATAWMPAIEKSAIWRGGSSLWSAARGHYNARR